MLSSIARLFLLAFISRIIASNNVKDVRSAEEDDSTSPGFDSNYDFITEVYINNDNDQNADLPNQMKTKDSDYESKNGKGSKNEHFDYHNSEDELRYLKNEKKEEGNEQICRTPTCKSVAERFEATINESVDPCQDFYQFSCGRWLAANKLPPDKESWGVMSMVSKRLSEQLKNLLLKPENFKSDHDAVVKAKNLYLGCANEEAREERGYFNIYQRLLGPYAWPLMDYDEDIWRGDDYDWHDHLAYLAREFEAKYLINMGIDFDKNNTKHRVIYLETPTFGIGRKQLIKPDIDKNVTMRAYQKLMIKILTEIGRDFTNNPEFKPRTKEIADIIQFERQLASISSDPSTFRNQFKSYGNGRISFDAFQQQYKYDVFDYVKKLFSKTEIKFDRDEKMMVVTDRNYYGNFSKIIPVEPSNDLKRIIANYLNWRAVRDLGMFTTRRFRQIDFEYQKEVNPELKQPLALWESCIDVVKHNLGYAVGRLYVDHHFKEEYKKDMLNMIKYIRKAFKKLLHDNKWMDQETKRIAKVKLDKMIYAIGYPDFIKNDTALSEFYSDLGHVDKDNYIDSLVMIKSWQTNKKLKTLKERVSCRAEIDWNTTPAVVNAYYNQNINRLTFPAGVLQPPAYQYGAPMEVNIGAIGSAIGHELTHGFDDKGSQFDEFGNLHQWWANETRKEFDKNKVCFIDQYSAYFDELANMTLNGKNSIGENIADNGGLREVYYAMQIYYKCKGQRTRLPGAVMSKYTPEQLMFISWGSIWCQHMTRKKMSDMIMNNNHSPSKYRVLVPTANSAEFSQAFSCPKAAPMNPDKKCILW